MQIAINFQNETIAQKVLWLLEHFKNDGVEIVRLDDSDEEIIDSFREGMKEIHLIEQGKVQSKPVEKFLDEL